MNVILFDQPDIRTALLPLTFTRPIGGLRVGILTIAEKWQKRLEEEVSFLTEQYLAQKFPLKSSSDNLLINGAICPDSELIEEIKRLGTGEALVAGTLVIAARSDKATLPDPNNFRIKEYSYDFTLINAPWQIFKKNAGQIRLDFELITAGRKSAETGDPHTILYGKENIFIEEGVKIRAAIINADTGPVYLGKNSELSEGSITRGAFSLGEGSTVSMGGKMRGDSTVGPFCKVGGEVSNSVIQGHSNKSHDGFLGNSVIGEWCNLGADTNTSNLKNNYANVKLWSYAKNSFVDTGENFCGLIMGDHSKSSINTMFNTGTVVGVSANIFGSGFPRNYIPSFAWGGLAGFSTFKIDKAFEVAGIVLERRKKVLDQQERNILTHIYNVTQEHRYWEKK